MKSDLVLCGMAEWQFAEWLLFWILETSFFEFEWDLVGPTLSGKLLQVAFVMRGDRVRVISARPAHKKERKRYEEILRKIT